MKSRMIQLLLATILGFTIPFQATSAKTATGSATEPIRVARTTIAEQTANTEDAEFVLVNATSNWLSLFVDGQRTVTVNPDDRGVVLVSVGTHTFRAVSEDGRSVVRTAYVSASGVTWTVSE